MKITVLENHLLISEYVTETITKLLHENVGHISIALSGGNTPKSLFSYWAEHCLTTIDWSRILFFWVDERCVATESEESNYGIAKRLFFDKTTFNSENIFFINGENDPDSEAVYQSEKLLQTISHKNGIPQFDLILLGMGNDGHTASIFPNQMKLLVSEKFYDIGIHPQSGQKRITLTGTVINNAKNVFFLVTGKDKAQVFTNIRYHQSGWISYPASHIKPLGNLKWVVDSEVIQQEK